MNQIITKDFHGSSIRLIIINGKEHFIAKDVALLLGYKDTPKAVFQHCKNVKSFNEILEVGKTPTLDLQPILGNSWKQIKIIPESDVWRLIVKSQLETAQEVENWIMEDVLPSIRKTGSYHIQPTEKSLKQKVEDLELAVKHYENIEKIFKKFGNFSKREFAEKTSNSVFLETGIDFLKMFGGFPKEEKHSFQNSFSLTLLLEKHNVQIQTYKFNLKLEKLGIIEKRGKSWFILNLDFGRNEDYQNENNPRYFEETFEKLLNLVYPSKEICEMPTI